MNWKRGDLIGGTEAATSCAVSPPDPKGDVRAVRGENTACPGAGGGCGPRVWHREVSALTWETRAARGKCGTQKCRGVRPRGRGALCHVEGPGLGHADIPVLGRSPDAGARRPQARIPLCRLLAT